MFYYVLLIFIGLNSLEDPDSCPRFSQAPGRDSMTSATENPTVAGQVSTPLESRVSSSTRSGRG